MAPRPACGRGSGGALVAAVLALVALVALLTALAEQVAATWPAARPARVVSTDNRPYPLTDSLSHDPAAAG